MTIMLNGSDLTVTQVVDLVTGGPHPSGLTRATPG